MTLGIFPLVGSDSEAAGRRLGGVDPASGSAVHASGAGASRTLATMRSMSDDIVIRLPRELARFLERTLYDVGEHIAGGREIVPGPPERERELGALMWDLCEA